MDIVAINNQIVAMRAAVKQAKVHVIRKMSRQAKLLKAKKGSEDQMSKNNRKVDRIVKEISTIKELNNDEISRFALTNTNTLKTLPKEQSADLPVFCTVKLAEHKAIVSAVNTCRKKFDDWEKELPQLLKMCEIRKLFKLTHQTPGKVPQRPKKQQLKISTVSTHGGSTLMLKPSYLNLDQKDNVHKNSSEIHCTLPEHESGDTQIINISDRVKQSFDNPVENSNNVEKSFHPVENSNRNIDDAGDQSDEDIDVPKIFIKKKAKSCKKEKPAVPTQLSKPVPIPKPIIVAEKRVGEIEVKRFILSERSPSDDGELFSNLITKSTNSDEDDEQKAITKCKDSFFVRNDDSLSDAAMSSNESIHEDMEEGVYSTSRPSLESTFISSLRQEKTRIFPPHRQHNKQTPNRVWQKPHETKFSGRPTGKDKSEHKTNRKERRQQLSIAQKPPVTVSSKDSLHPSWDAKRRLKLQSQIHQFQGKKIKFDD